MGNCLRLVQWFQLNYFLRSWGGKGIKVIKVSFPTRIQARLKAKLSFLFRKYIKAEALLRELICGISYGRAYHDPRLSLNASYWVYFLTIISYLNCKWVISYYEIPHWISFSAHRLHYIYFVCSASNKNEELFCFMTKMRKKTIMFLVLIKSSKIMNHLHKCFSVLTWAL